MKIAFFFGSMQRGGAERVIASLANTFCAGGDEVHIITTDNTPPGYALDERVKHIPLDLSRVSRNKLDGLRRNMQVLLTLRKLINANRYDAVIPFYLRDAVLLTYAYPFGRKFKLITSERANPKQRKLSRFMKLQYDLILPRVDGFIFQTERVSLCFSETLRKKGRVIHNGVFSEILPETITPFEQRRHHDICAVGRLSDQKGYDVMLDAFARFLATHPSRHLHIYGEGPLLPKLEAQIASLGLDGHVTLHGSVPNVMHHVADMGMFVMASRFEGMPNALMEAMACGLPCVSADCDFGPAELIRDGENGLLVPVEDADALAGAMGRIADDPALARRLSGQAVDIRQTHSGEEISRQYRDYIAEVVSGK